MPPRTKNIPGKNTPEPTLKTLLDRIRPTASTRARKDEKKKAVLEEEYDDEPEQQLQVDHEEFVSFSLNFSRLAEEFVQILMPTTCLWLCLYGFLNSFTNIWSSKICCCA